MAGGGGDEATDFDLTALMDVLSNIIFFLMASFGAAVVAVVPASVPTISESGENDTAIDEDKVTATMRLHEDGKVEITVANNDMLPAELKPYARTFPPKEGKADLKAVTEHLWSIKGKFKGSKDIMILPDDKVSYAQLIDAMDASRSYHIKASDGSSKYPKMFPAAIVSSMVK